MKKRLHIIVPAVAFGMLILDLILN